MQSTKKTLPGSSYEDLVIGSNGSPLSEDLQLPRMSGSSSTLHKTTSQFVLSKPIEPTFNTINARATELAALTADEFKRLKFLHVQYRSQLQIYRDQQKSLASIQQHMVKTIGNYYNTISDEDDLAKDLILLKARVQPTDWAQEHDGYY